MKKSKAFKQVLSLLLCAVMVLGAAPLAGLIGLDLPGTATAKAVEATSGVYTYTVSNNEAAITNVDDSISGDITVPETLGGYIVTSIDEDAFSYCSNIKSVKITSSYISNIGEFAFANCENLESVTLSAAVNDIGDYAFYNCKKLESFSVDANNSWFSSNEHGILFNKEKTELLKYPSGLSATSYTIPNGVMTIGCDSFACSDNLKTVLFADSVKYISDDSFCSCSNLESVEFPNGTKSIGYRAFYTCTSLSSITIPDSVTYIDDAAFENTLYFDTNSNWVNGVLRIGNHIISVKKSFEGSFTVENGVKTIANDAFFSCALITSVTIPKSVVTVGKGAFFLCTGIGWINVDSNNPNYSSDEKGVLFNKAKTELLQYPLGNSRKSYTVPDSVTIIGSYSFADSKFLETIVFGTGTQLKIIGNGAFESLANLKSMVIPNGVVTLGNYLFFGSKELISVTIPYGVTSISEKMFYYCEKLESVIIPNSVTSIGEDAFLECTKLADVYYSGTDAEWAAISDGGNNECLFNANIHTNQTITPLPPVEPTTKPSEPAFKFEIRKPSITTISYGDSIILHADIEGTLPDGGRVEWSLDNNNFNISASADGTTCTITPSSSGDTTFTATIYDKDGNIIDSDTQKMTSKAGFFDKIIAFFKKLFGLNKNYEQATGLTLK